MKTKLILGLLAMIGMTSLVSAGGLNISVNLGGNRGGTYGSRGYCAPVAYCAPVYYSYPVVSAYSWGPNVVAYQGNVSSGFTTVRTVPTSYNTAPVYQVPPPIRPVPVQVQNFGWHR